jgi:VWFA-related protein
MNRRLGPVACVLLIVARAIAQQPASSAQAQGPSSKQSSNDKPAAQPAMVLRVTSRLVVLDVVAADGHGKPITDLKQEDFSVLEDGKPQAITVFSLERPDAANTVASPPPKKPAGEVNNYPNYKPSGAMYVLLLDGLNTSMQDQAYLREQLIKLLEKLPNGRPISIYLLGTNLRLLQDFTSNGEALKTAIKNYRTRNSPLLDNGVTRASGGDYAPGGVESTLALTPEMQEQLAAFYNESVSIQTDFRVRTTLAALRAIADAMGGYYGRKNLIWVSAAFPINIFPDDPSDAHAWDTMRDYREEVERTASILSDAQVSVYPIDARGLVGSTSNVAQRTGYNQRRGNPQAIYNRMSDDLFAARTTMGALADITGGRAMAGRNDLDEAIRECLDQDSTYYALGYVPANADWNGKFRKITVKTSRKDVRLRYRTGYLATDPEGFSHLSDRQRAIEFGQALDLNTPIATALPFRARAVPPTPESKGKSMVYFGADPHAISFEPQPNGAQNASVDCAVRAFTMKGQPVKIETGQSTASLTPENFKTIMRSFFPCRVAPELAPGDYLLRLAIRDSRTGLIGSANTTLTVPTPASPSPETK